MCGTKCPTVRSGGTTSRRSARMPGLMIALSGASDPRSTVETVVHHLPGRRITLPDGTRLEESAHPLKQFVFDNSFHITKRTWLLLGTMASLGVGRSGLADITR